MSSVIQVIYASAPVPRILIPIVLVGQVFLIYDFHSPCFQTASQLTAKGRRASEDTKWLGQDTCLTWVLRSQINPR